MIFNLERKFISFFYYYNLLKVSFIDLARRPGKVQPSLGTDTRIFLVHVFGDEIG